MDSKKYFIYLDTDNADIIKKAVELKNTCNSGKLNLFIESEVNKKSEYLINETIINKFNDYTLEDYKILFPGERKHNKHSLLSFAFYSGSKVHCFCDKFGVMPYYYYKKDKIIIISNNSVLIAYLVNAGYSTESIFDALIFMKPYGIKTWFKDIYCLNPGEKLIYNSIDKSLNLQIYYSMYDELFKMTSANFTDIFRDYFIQFSNTKSNNETGISLSGGSDSRAVLAGLIYIKNKFKCYSWGDQKYLELHKISKLVKKFNLHPVIIKFEELKENFDRFVEKGIFATSGLLTAIHQYYFYGHLPQNINQFEGYLGSEFVKGELSDGMVTEIYSDIVKYDYSLKDNFDKYFPLFNQNIKKDFIEYIYDNYSDKFININSGCGKEEFQKYLFDFIPSKIFGGLIPQGLLQGINYYLPYFSSLFLKSLFSAGYGIKNNISLRGDFPGTIRITDAQAKIVKALNPDLYNSLLDRNIKYKEVYYPHFISHNLMKIRIFKDKILTGKYNFTGQVDFEDVKEHSLYQNMQLNEYLYNFFGQGSSGNKYLKYISYYFNVFDVIRNKDRLTELI